MAIAPDDLADSEDERSQELATVASIFPDELTILTPTSATVSLPVSPLTPLVVTFSEDEPPASLSHLPPITLKFELPESYPADDPPLVEISTEPPWLSDDKISKLKAEIRDLWEDFGHGQTVYTAIDHVQQCAERGFDLSDAAPFALGRDMKHPLQSFNDRTTKQIFEKSTYECGICLEPKKGNLCHAIRSCTHVYCLPCLVDYYSQLITEGDVSLVRCMDQACVKKAAENSLNRGRQNVAELPQTLPPEELSEIGLKAELVGRYVALKKKKALEVDPRTMYCPRQWCQGPTRSSVKDLEDAMAASRSGYYLPDRTSPLPPTPPPEEEEGEADTEKPREKLQQCSVCGFAFCRVCKASWHGDYQICRAPDAELTEEERQNEEYLRTHTTPCPQCQAATLKSYGCNHMTCSCGTHFCFLCSAYLPPENPYSHFNTKGSYCYQRLWEGEEGDEENIQLIRNEGRHVEIPLEPEEEDVDDENAPQVVGQAPDDS